MIERVARQTISKQWGQLTALLRFPQFANWFPSPARNAMEAFKRMAREASDARFAGGFPNFREERQGMNTIGEVIFLHHSGATWTDVPISDLKNPDLENFQGRMRATQDYASGRGFAGGFPTFYQDKMPILLPTRGIVQTTVCGTVLLTTSCAVRRDVFLKELGSPPLNDIAARFKAADDYAIREGYVGGFPNFSDRLSKGFRTVCGTILIKPGYGERRNIVIIKGF
jgi:hypothetical protein